MIKVIIAAFLFVLLILFVRGLIKDNKVNKVVEEANDRLRSIKNEHKVMDIEEKVRESEQNLKYRKNSK